MISSELFDVTDVTAEACPHLLIHASAGTGKTFHLSNRYLKLILTGCPCDTIMAATFTRKAAGEILARIVYRLALAASDAEHCRELATALELKRLNMDDCREALAKLTRSLHRIRIGTLDSFFLQMAQSLSLELGLPPVWNIADEMQETDLKEQAIRTMLLQQEADAAVEVMHWIAKGESRRSVTALIHETIDKAYDIYLSSLPAAWCTLKRVRPLSSNRLRQAREQLRAICDQLETRQERNAILKDLGLIDSESFLAMTKAGISKKLVEGDTTFYRKPISAELQEAYKPFLQQAEWQLRERLVNKAEATAKLLGLYDQHFDAVKLAQRRLCFRDLTRWLSKLRDRSLVEECAFRMDAGIECLLLDEFQDTSLQQWQIMLPLAQHAAELSGRSSTRRRSFFCVGDAKQGIYGWRGGDANLLSEVRRQLSTVSDQTLDKSYRSSPAVIDVVNQVFKNLDRHDNLADDQVVMEKWKDRFPHHQTHRQQFRGHVTLETARPRQNDEKRDNVFALATKRIHELTTNVPRASIGVLVRTNECVGKLIYRLHELGVPASEEGGNPLTDSAAVLAMLSLLTLADHPGDSAARFHVASLPWTIGEAVRGANARAGSLRLSRQIRTDLMDCGFGKSMLQYALQLKPVCDEREWKRLQQLVELGFLHQFQIERPMQIGSSQQSRTPIRTMPFIDQVRQRKMADPLDAKIRVMTVHQAKGLQFDIVVLPDLDRRWTEQSPLFVVDRKNATSQIDRLCAFTSKDFQPLLPDGIRRIFANNNERVVTEELCVLYVALTRAKYAMHMIVEPKKKSTHDRTLAGLIEAALLEPDTPLPPETTVWETGDPNWYQTHFPHDPPHDATQVMTAERPVSTGKVTQSDQHRDQHRVDRFRTAASGKSTATVKAPSELQASRGMRVANILHPARREAQRRGSLLHRALEAVDWEEPNAAAIQSVRDCLQSMRLDEQQRTDLEQLVAGVLAHPDTGKLFRQSWFRGDVADDEQIALRLMREHPVAGWFRGDWIQGFVDRLVVRLGRGKPAQAYIIDFKTDAATTESELQQAVSHHKNQMQAYQAIVASSLNLDVKNVSAQLLFLDALRVFDV